MPTLGTSTHGFCETESTQITCDHLKGGWDDCATKWKDWEPETATTTPAGEWTNVLGGLTACVAAPNQLPLAVPLLAKVLWLYCIVKLILCGLYYATTTEPVTTTEPAATPELAATTPAGEWTNVLGLLPPVSLYHKCQCFVSAWAPLCMDRMLTCACYGRL